MSNVDDSTLSAYNSLTDPHLKGYFSNTRVRRHLRRVGLVNRTGDLVNESTYRINLSRKAHRKHFREMLAQSIIERSLDFERQRQFEIRKQLEQLAKIEMVRRVRVGETNDRLAKSDPLLRSIMSAPDGKGGRGGEGRRPRRKAAFEDSPSVSDDDSQDDDDDSMDDDDTRIPDIELDTRQLADLPTSSLGHLRTHSNDIWWREGRVALEAPGKAEKTPRPPAEPRPPERKPTTTQRPVKGTTKKPKKKSVQIKDSEPVEIHFRFYGKKSKVQKELDAFEAKSIVTVEQQHCGGENITIYRGKLAYGDPFVVKSQRNPDFPLGLTFFISGKEDCRLSACCEYKHRPGTRLGKNGYFGVVSTRGGKPCFKCQMETQYRKARKAEKSGRKQPRPPLEPKPKKDGKEPAPSIREIPAKSADGDDDDDRGQYEQALVEDGDEPRYDEDFHDSDDDSKSSKSSSSESDSDSSSRKTRTDTHVVKVVENADDAVRDEQQAPSPINARSLSHASRKNDDDDDEEGERKIDLASVSTDSRPASAVKTRPKSSKPLTKSPSPPPTPVEQPRRFRVSSRSSSSGRSGKDSSSSSESESEKEEKDEKEETVSRHSEPRSRSLTPPPTLKQEELKVDSDGEDATSIAPTLSPLPSRASTSRQDSRPASKHEDAHSIKSEQPKSKASSASSSRASTPHGRESSKDEKSLKSLKSSKSSAASSSDESETETEKEAEKEEEKQPTPTPTPTPTPRPPSPSSSEESEESEVAVRKPLPRSRFSSTSEESKATEKEAEKQPTPRSPSSSSSEESKPAEKEAAKTAAKTADDESSSGSTASSSSSSEADETYQAPTKRPKDVDAIDPRYKESAFRKLYAPLEDEQFLEAGDSVNVDFPLTDEQFDFVCERMRAKKDAHVRFVTFSNCSLNDDQVTRLVESMRGYDALMSLNLTENEIGPEGARSVAEYIKSAPGLKSLELYGNPLTDAGVKQLVDSLKERGNRATLRQLGLGSSGMTDVGMGHVADLVRSNMASLADLSLSDTSDASKEAWIELASALEANKNVKSLTLDKCGLGGSEGGLFDLLEAIAGNESLQDIDLESNNLTRSDGEKLLGLLKRRSFLPALRNINVYEPEADEDDSGGDDDALLSEELAEKLRELIQSRIST